MIVMGFDHLLSLRTTGALCHVAWMITHSLLLHYCDFEDFGSFLEESEACIALKT